MRRRVLTTLLAMATSVAGCSSIDSALEGAVPADNRISVGLENTSLTVAQGGDASVGATITRLADYAGTVDLTVDDAPAGVSVQVAPGATNGKSTTASLTIHVSPDVKPGTYIVTVRARGTAGNVAGTILSITIVEPPAYTVGLARGNVTLLPGGAAPLGIRLTRRNFDGPVTVSGSSATSGISASSAVISGDTGTIIVAAARSVAPGAYVAQITGKAAGLADRTASLAVNVSSASLLIAADSAVTVAQAQSVTTTVAVSHAESVTGSVTVRAENLPAGLTATITPQSSGYDVALAAAASTTPGTYAVTLRASAAGVADATAVLVVNVAPASISLSLSPASVSVFPGTSVTTTAQIARSSYSGNVTVTAENLPAGVTASVSQFSAGGSSATISLAAASNAAPGTYSATVRATPIDLGASASKTASLEIIVRAAPSGTGNVILDWSKCTAPDWVAGQDGAAAWVPLTGVQGVYRFTVNSSNGGFAWVESGSSVNVRYMTKAQLTVAAINMCTVPGTKTVTGTAVQHSLTGTEQFFWNLGGGVGISTPQNNNFNIIGVKDGVHDLVAWAQSNFAGPRGLIRRDLDLPDNTSLGAVNITGTDGFAGVQVPITVTGSVVSGDQYAYTMRLLTGSGCDDNFLYSGGGSTFGGTSGINFTSQFAVMPDEQLRPTDFHVFTVNLTRSAVIRSASIVAHTMQGKLNTVAPNLTAPTVTYPAGAYKRMQVAYGSDVSIRYNDMLTLQYNDGRSRFMSVSATKDYWGSQVPNLAMPDLSTVAGFPLAAALPSNATGSYVSQLSGLGLPGSLCQEGNSVISIRHSGNF